MRDLPIVETVGDVIERFGGAKIVSAMFDVNPNLPYGWKHRGSLPQRLHWRMDKEAAKKKFSIDPTLFGDEPV